MSKIHFITFADSKMSPTLKQIKKEAKKSCFFDVIHCYNERVFEKNYWEKFHSFYENNPRGFGYWIWKPYLIDRELKQMEEGDILVYLDSGCIINATGKEMYNEYLRILNEGESIICFEHENCFAKQYNKADFLKSFDLLEDEMFLESRQLMAGILLVKKCNTSVRLIQEWKDFMHNNTALIDDTPSKIEEKTSFKEHRHDQSVFSALCYKHGIKGRSQYEVYPNEGDWSTMKDFPFWAARRKIYAKESLISRIIRRIRNFK